MKQCLFMLLFLTGVVPFVLCVPRKYYLIQQGKTWSDAQAYCKANHTDLAIIQSNDNMVRLQDEIQKQQFSSSAWIGLYREIGTWHWSLGNEPLGMTAWLSGQPNGAPEWCGTNSPMGWGDFPCTYPLPFVCFDDTKTGVQSYIYFSNTMTWYAAQAYCRTYYTDLASARNVTEDSIIKGLTSGWTHFGLVNEIWKMTDQNIFAAPTPISWMSGKPSITQNLPTCGYLNGGQAADALCTGIKPFFCYRVITGKQQIMRMEVRSDKDVNDPAVMDAIMEKIEQKLKEHGLAGNVTVKWRVQPDGKVFHKKK